MTTFAEKVISFCKELDYTGSLPSGISIMNPFRDSDEIMTVVSRFYQKYYNDNKFRHLILGINPGRFGAGVTGIPFTDTKRLTEKCGIVLKDSDTYETSSVFIYEMIDKYGSTESFYSDFYISSVCPLGFTTVSKRGRGINYNYYDSKELTDCVVDFIIGSIKKQLEFGIERDICFSLGTGKNFRFLSEINKEYHFFERIIPLEHPRYIMQYRLSQKHFYINSYLEKFRIIR